MKHFGAREDDDSRLPVSQNGTFCISNRTANTRRQSGHTQYVLRVSSTVSSAMGARKCFESPGKTEIERTRSVLEAHTVFDH